MNKNKSQLQKQRQLWQLQKQALIQKEQIKKEKREIKEKYKQKNKFAFSKFLVFFLFLNCTVVEVITFILTFKTVQLGIIDFSSLQMLITAIVGEVIGFSIYSLKSLKQNTTGGIVYQTAIREQQKENQYNYQEEVDQ